LVDGVSFNSSTETPTPASKTKFFRLPAHSSTLPAAPKSARNGISRHLSLPTAAAKERNAIPMTGDFKDF
jgi:hypothetical protein